MIEQDRFWNTDLNDIEEKLIGRSIDELPIHFDDRVPPSEVIFPVSNVPRQKEKCCFWKRFLSILSLR